MSHRVGGRKGGYAGGRGIQTLQVSKVNDGHVAISNMLSDIEISFGYL